MATTNKPTTTRKAPAKKATPKKAAPVQSPVITVIAQPKKQFGGARGAYWAVFKAHNGKTLAQLAAHVAANPPSVPSRGKLAGKPEPLSGWVGFFKRQGLITLG